jgi:predicted DCC family thiol-disulfide oxidoreductase YuxK
VFHVEQVTAGHDPGLNRAAGGHPVMVFDGACNLCHFWVGFALRRDAGDRLRFLAAQAPLGQDFLRRNALPSETYESFYLVVDGEILQKSRGFLRLVGYLRAPWPCLRVLGILPAALLDPLYDLVARNRYRWFGTRDLCLVPDLRAVEKFLR